MKKKTKLEIAVVFLLFLVLACYMDFSQRSLEDGTLIRRGQEGEADLELELLVDAEDVLSEYPYQLVVEAQKPTYEEIQSYFAAAKEEIDADFCREGENLSHVTEAVCIKSVQGCHTLGQRKAV